KLIGSHSFIHNQSSTACSYNTVLVMSKQKQKNKTKKKNKKLNSKLQRKSTQVLHSALKSFST
ncbi:hypothetical protein OFM13_33420, partial [Escherichia coli]|nr:hypothetical protein [Escherichia coli]